MSHFPQRAEAAVAVYSGSWGWSSRVDSVCLSWNSLDGLLLSNRVKPQKSTLSRSRQSKARA